MNQAGEASVEEILESIKKVIARDNRTGSVEQRRRRETNGPDISPASQVAPGPAVDPDDVLDLAQAEAWLASGDEAEATDAEAFLINPDARASMRESLAALAVLAEPRAQPQIVRSGETSLEGLVRELLRPALAEWLDSNLPALVERLVAVEIARIVGKKG